MIDLKQNNKFKKLLLEWHDHLNQRQLPWKYERNPYYIWLSEIILQQTRAEQGTPYFLKFKSSYPTILDLANAPLDDILTIWQGLGYYSRARNLHKAANQIVKMYGGVFPNKHEELLQLAGVGDYTASAISSFAFDEPNAVLDGNVTRVLSRYFGISEAFDTTRGKKVFRAKAQELLDIQNPATYNQAIMDFGATVCLPQNPKCSDCIFAASCFAIKHELIAELPVKKKKIAIKNRFFTYLLITENEKILIRQRQQKDIWQGLWELPMIETEKPIRKQKSKIASLIGISSKDILSVSDEYTQLLSHQKIHSTFIDIEPHSYSVSSQDLWIKTKDLVKYGFPKTILSFLKEKHYF